MLRRVRISMPLNSSFILFTSCPSTAAHPSVWFRCFCFRVCVPERLADKMRLHVAWPENVSKKKKGGARKKRGHQIEYAREAKVRVVGLQGRNSLSPGFWNSMGVGGEESCLED